MPVGGEASGEGVTNLGQALRLSVWNRFHLRSGCVGGAARPEADATIPAAPDADGPSLDVD